MKYEWKKELIWLYYIIGLNIIISMYFTVDIIITLENDYFLLLNYDSYFIYN